MAGELFSRSRLPRTNADEIANNTSLLAKWIYEASIEQQKQADTDFTAGDGLTLTGTQFSHGNTSDVADLTTNNTQVVSTVTFDEFGHVTEVTTRNLTASNGVTVVGADFQHSNTSSISNKTLSGASVLSTVTFDTFGHVQDLTSRTLTPTDIGAEAAFTKNTAFNKDFGTLVDEVLEGGSALGSIADLVTVADRMIYTTSADTYDVTTLTSYARTLLDDSSASSARNTLGLGSIATEDTGASGTFTTADAKTVTVANGIITSIV